jgi:hypothetical protein
MSSPALLPLRLSHEQPFTAGRLRLFFDPTRAVLVDASVGSGPPPKERPTAKPVKLAFELALDPAGLPSGSALTVGVRYERCPPQLAGAIWLPAAKAAPVIEGGPATVTTADEPLASLPYTKSSLELAQLRQQLIKEATGLGKTWKEFFFEMDVDTDADLASLSEKPKAQLDELHKATALLQPVLFDRVQDRGRFGQSTTQLTDPLVKPEFKAAMSLVMKCLEDLIQKHGIDSPGVSGPGLDATFEAFARGDLRVVTSIKADDGTAVSYTLNGEPDSPNYFLLAELAILARQVNPSSPLWPRLLRIFVRTQEIYRLAYAPRGAALQTWPDYTAKSYRGPGVPSDQVVADLRVKYATTSLEDLEGQATTNAQNAFCW